jgi:hypothetical protein
MMKHVACGMVWLSARGAYTDASPLADVRSCVGAAKQVTMAGRCRPGEHRIKRLRGLCAKSCQKSFRRRVPRDNQDERPATIKMRMAPGVG